jgi:hypothetical protein
MKFLAKRQYKMNITRQDLIKLIKEEMEGPYDPTVSNATRLSKTSIDDQVDSFILNYERMSLREESDEDEDAINESLSSNSLSVLLEAGEDELADAPPDDLAADQAPPPDDTVPDDSEDSDDDNMIDGEDSDADEPEEEPVPLIDIDQFVQRVARLATRPEHLLDLKTAIVNRALKFLSDNYTDSHVEKAQDILSNNFDFDFSTRFDNEEEIPAAYGAGGEPSGGLGSGA